MSSANGATDNNKEHWTTRLYTWSWQNRWWFRVIASVLIVVVIALPTYAVFHHFGFKDGAPIAQAIAAFAAIIVGAAWAYMAFVRNRQKYPRANTSVAVQELPMPDGRILLKVTNEIENIGDVLVSIEYVRCDVYQVMPWPSEKVIQNSVLEDRDIEIDYEYKNEENAEDVWPCLDFREKSYEKDEFEIEPGEKDAIIFDMLANKDASLVRIYTYVRNEGKRRQNQIGWSKVLFYKMGVDGYQENGAEESGNNASAFG